MAWPELGAASRNERQCGLLDRADVHGLRPLVAGLGLVLHARALGERAVAVRFDAAVVDEEVLAAFIGCDEAEALLVAEPLNGALCHVFPPRRLSCCVCRGSSKATVCERLHCLRRTSARPKLRAPYHGGGMACQLCNRTLAWRGNTTCTIRPMAKRDAAVIGAGPAGLATAATLRERGVDVVVIDRAESVGASWRGHYDRLHLHTVRWLSHLPGLRIPRSSGRWVSRDDVVAYLERYAAHHELDLMLGTDVTRLARADGGWALDTSGGDVEAGSVVVATGYNHTPYMPDYPGREGFEGELLHASKYRNAEPYRGRDVLVVGSGNTGAEIAVDLVEGGARRVRLAVRTPPNIVLRDSGGVPSQVIAVASRRMPPKVADRVLGPVQRAMVGDLSRYGLPRPERGAYTRLAEDDVVPILDVGLIAAVKREQVEVVGALVGFDGRDVILAGRERIQPDAVIVATGYRRGLERLVGHLGVLAANGRPLVHGPQMHPAAPNLYFTGYTNPISGMFREMAIDARRIGRAVARAMHARNGRPHAAA